LQATGDVGEFMSSRDLMVENSIKAKTNHTGLVTEIS